MRAINAATKAALAESVIRFAFLALVEFPTSRRLAFTSLPRNYEFNGETFLGAGELGSVSPAAADSNLEPASFDITVSGISDDILSAVGDLQYMNFDATVWLLVLDEDLQVIGDPMLWFKGLTDQITVRYGDVSSVSISVRNRMADWARARIRRYTDGDHQQLYPGDKFFEFVSEVAAKDVEWPADSWFEKQK